jgi:hypothetical protein
LANECAGGSYFDGGDVGEVGEGGFEVMVVTDRAAREGEGTWGQIQKRSRGGSVLANEYAGGSHFDGGDVEEVGEVVFEVVVVTD